ncbi:MAG: radical SAM protein [Patescibacteria group bacterium]
MTPKIRLSLGSAAVLGLKNAAVRTKTKTIFLLNSGGCVFNCGFCAQARNSTISGGDKLSRVSWPEFDVEEVLTALKNKQKEYQRICWQVVNTPGIFVELPEFVGEVRKNAGKKKIALSIRTNNPADIDALFSAGADEIGLSIDAIDPEEFKKIKGGDGAVFKNFVLRIADKYPGKIATHLIIGLGETEKQAVELARELHEHKVIIALFAFTPVKGSGLEFNRPPDIHSYRRIQIALHLIRNNLAREFSFNKNGQIADFGYNKNALLAILKNSNVFETSGCSDCNRPYYNERAGDEELYNYPQKCDGRVIEKMMEELLIKS